MPFLKDKLALFITAAAVVEEPKKPDCPACSGNGLVPEMGKRIKVEGKLVIPTRPCVCVDTSVPLR